MELPINQDPEELNKSAYAGKKPWQYVCIFISILIAVAFVWLFQRKLGTTLSSLICVVLITPTGLIGLFQKNGMDFFEYRKRKKHIKETGGIYLYETEPYRKVVQNEKNKKGFKYIMVNIITGGKKL